MPSKSLTNITHPLPNVLDIRIIMVKRKTKSSGEKLTVSKNTIQFSGMKEIDKNR